jgi:hypothetical protein
MSQAGSVLSGGSGPVEGILEIDTQEGVAAPIANVALFNAYDTTQNNIYGIETKGNTFAGFPADTGAGATNEFDVYLTNRFHGSATTTDATPTTIATCPMSTNPAVFRFTVELVAYDSTDNSGFTTISSLSFLTNGATPVLLFPEDHVTQESTGATFPASTSVNLNGTSTNFNVIVTGAAGKTITWLCHGHYTMVT